MAKEEEPGSSNQKTWIQASVASITTCHSGKAFPFPNFSFLRTIKIVLVKIAPVLNVIVGNLRVNRHKSTFELLSTIKITTMKLQLSP